MSVNGQQTNGDDITATRTGAWEPDPGPTLDALIAVAGYSGDRLNTDAVPWRGNHQLDIVAAGGLRSHDRRRVTVVPGTYSSYARQALKVRVDGDHSSRFDHNLTSSTTDEDKLVVEGAADIDIGERMTMASGTIDRVWTGAITRLVGMEGVICGGVYAQILGGMSSTVAGVVSGDVYGGCARVAALRSYIAALGYRSADGPVAWAMGAYVRKTAFVIEPIVGSPGREAPDKGASRIGKLMLKIGGGVCPFVEIGAGVVSLVALFPLLIAGAVRKKMGKVKKPPQMLPRTRVRNCGVVKESAALDMTT